MELDRPPPANYSHPPYITFNILDDSAQLSALFHHLHRSWGIITHTHTHTHTHTRLHLVMKSIFDSIAVDLPFAGIVDSTRKNGEVGYNQSPARCNVAWRPARNTDASASSAPTSVINQL